MEKAEDLEAKLKLAVETMRFAQKILNEYRAGKQMTVLEAEIRMMYALKSITGEFK
jgi:FtsZ-binding cell division protein ZapB